MKKEYISGLKAGIPICLGYISVSFAFGIVAIRGGLSIINAVIMSFTNLASAGQFAGLNVITSNGGLIEIAVATFIINLRYMLMSLSLSQKISPSTGTAKRLLMSFGITDEIFALSASKEGTVTFPYFIGLMTLPILGWGFGTFLGGFANSVLPESIRLALGVALYAMFIAIIIPPAKKSKPILIVALIAIIISCIINAIPAFYEISSGWRAIIATVMASSVGAVIFPERSDDK